MADEKNIRRIAVLGNHLPRHCGIATFTTDLSDAISAVGADLDCFVLAVNDAGHQHAYPSRVRFELADNDVAAYTRAADFRCGWRHAESLLRRGRHVHRAGDREHSRDPAWLDEHGSV